jgi:hypothetical protein
MPKTKIRKTRAINPKTRVASSKKLYQRTRIKQELLKLRKIMDTARPTEGVYPLNMGVSVKRIMKDEK